MDKCVDKGRFTVEEGNGKKDLIEDGCGYEEEEYVDKGDVVGTGNESMLKFETAFMSITWRPFCGILTFPVIIVTFGCISQFGKLSTGAGGVMMGASCKEGWWEFENDDFGRAEEISWTDLCSTASIESWELWLVSEKIWCCEMTEIIESKEIKGEKKNLSAMKEL